MVEPPISGQIRSFPSSKNKISLILPDHLQTIIGQRQVLCIWGDCLSFISTNRRFNTLTTSSSKRHGSMQYLESSGSTMENKAYPPGNEHHNMFLKRKETSILSRVDDVPLTSFPFNGGSDMFSRKPGNRGVFQFSVILKLPSPCRPSPLIEPP